MSIIKSDANYSFKLGISPIDTRKPLPYSRSMLHIKYRLSSLDLCFIYHLICFIGNKNA